MPTGFHGKEGGWPCNKGEEDEVATGMAYRPKEREGGQRRCWILGSLKAVRMLFVGLWEDVGCFLFSEMISDKCGELTQDRAQWLELEQIVAHNTGSGIICDPE